MIYDEKLMCGACGNGAPWCENAESDRHDLPAWHDHEYDEWWCRACAADFGDEFNYDDAHATFLQLVPAGGGS